MFLYPVACDLDEELLELVTTAIVACDGDRLCRLRPYDRARCTLVYLRKARHLRTARRGIRCRRGHGLTLRDRHD
ncbi:hypothetical protein GCM10022295_92550 [Streptomyces osmaniensis]|uniref:Transposase n=1 Tax=Streptomyces osmaniensis TaxID=593134 RepID=A0ABP6Z401_9ACTN